MKVRDNVAALPDHYSGFQWLQQALSEPQTFENDSTHSGSPMMQKKAQFPTSTSSNNSQFKAHTLKSVYRKTSVLFEPPTAASPGA